MHIEYIDQMASQARYDQNPYLWAVLDSTEEGPHYK